MMMEPIKPRLGSTSTEVQLRISVCILQESVAKSHASSASEDQWGPLDKRESLISEDGV